MKVLLGVAGCIGAYKSAEILRLLQAEGVNVIPIMTENARHFIGPLTLNKLSGLPMPADPFQPGSGEIDHISLARQSHLLLVAPATANIMAKFAVGIADDLLSTLYLATTTPVLVAPAMNVEMWKHPATRLNVEILKQRGVIFAGPESGYQACGEVGEGRLADPGTITRMALELLKPGETLRGIRVLVTAGPTVEDIDPVRFISNRSSGKMGYAIAAEAVSRGAAVSLVSGPSHLEPPQGTSVYPVRSADEMAVQVLELAPDMDIIIKAAAVADYTPSRLNPDKIKKNNSQSNLNLVPTRDILDELGKSKREGQILVGFAAESNSLKDNARAKLQRKNLDLVVANQISGEKTAFNSDYNQVLIIDRNLEEISLPRMEKSEVARNLWDIVARIRSKPNQKPK